MSSAAVICRNHSLNINSRVLSVDGILNTGTVLGEQAFDLMFESVGLEERCPYIQDMGRALRDRYVLLVLHSVCSRRIPSAICRIMHVGASYLTSLPVQAAVCDRRAAHSRRSVMCASLLSYILTA